MDLLVQLILKIPNVIWSAIIASCLTFFGVLLTNRGNEKRQAAQLKHEEFKYQSQQKFELKKEVYLNAAQSFYKVLSVIPKLSDLSFEHEYISSIMNDHQEIIAKVYLVAKEDSVATIMNYSADLIESLLVSMKQRMVLLDQNSAVDVYRTALIESNKEKDRLVAMVQELQVSGRRDNDALKYLSERFQSQVNITQKHQSSLDAQIQKLAPQQKIFFVDCMKEHARLLSLISPVILALRSELELDEDSKLFIDAFNADIKRMSKAFEKAFDY